MHSAVLPGIRAGCTRMILPAFLFLFYAAPALGQASAEAWQNLDKLVRDMPAFNKGFTGFILYDPEKKQRLSGWNDDKYFTPASNTKIFTFLTATLLLPGDSLPLAHYEVIGDTLLFWGAGNPAWLHPELPLPDPLTPLLKAWPGPVFYTDRPFKTERFGPGWAWDDYPDNYQVERTPMPAYANLVEFHRLSDTSEVVAFPAFFRDSVTIDNSAGEDTPDLERAEFANKFKLKKRLPFDFSEATPYRYSSGLMAGLLSDTTGRQIRLWRGALPRYEKPQTLFMPAPDTIYKRLMQDSDNFIAEQLILQCSDRLFGVQDAGRMLRYARDTLIAGAPDQFYWNDGSGLSRYNLFTPRSVVYALEQLYYLIPRERLFATFPAGGVSGTIQGLYEGPGGKPYVFAKTGTLRNKHCLSGYLVAQSGKVYIFSFMHNNFTGSSTPIKKGMNTILRWIRERG